MMSKLKIIGLQILTLIGTLLFLQRAAHADLMMDLRGSNGRWVTTESNSGVKVKAQVAHSPQGQPLYVNVLIYSPAAKSYTAGLTKLEAANFDEQKGHTFIGGKKTNNMWLQRQKWTGLDITVDSLLKTPSKSIQIVNVDSQPIQVRTVKNQRYNAGAPVVSKVETVRFAL